MCRLAAHVGEPTPLSRLLYDRPRSLEVLAYDPRELQHGIVNVDGTGVAWWPDDDPTPVRYATASPPWSDANLPSLSRRLISTSILAAVRSATPGIPFGVGQVAPFVADGVAFAHNGWVGGFRTGTRLALDSHVATDIQLEVDAISDSLSLFGIFRTLHRDNALEPALREALAIAGSAATAQGEQAALNVVVATHDEVLATRHGVGLPGNSLYTASLADGNQLASEPLNPDEPWEAVPDNSLVRLTADEITITPF